ncbi:hypothetical protein J7E79_23765 [Bacillus sp. ISL-40]|uniref:hypothetical protein n=1 Tax=unclassified Bacillus (in: firmicutes) TaxID=185979 RepID=UPI001BE8BE40|nr:MULTISPECIES: hypothetical protein [unclassified Bacillus (in: firmicutes)]MBT2700381.1 hypothetical protein [Bacillus sp. ISL-40]MBT2722269.1 hypothetical protein [Bacillus sp. ISL-46]MBT2742414.1 hypothetical protein [Bacillus sp. ISL-77]
MFEDVFLLLAIFLLSILAVYAYQSKKRQEELEAYEARLSEAGIREIDLMDGVEFEQYRGVLQLQNSVLQS